jgi:predicted acetyltransferase
MPPKGATMELRPAAPDDIPWLATLWAHAFPGERSVAVRARELETGGPYGTLADVRIAVQHGRAIGACKLHAMRQRLSGATLPMAGLAAVAIAPEARRAGAGRTLCRLALREAYERGDAVSVLYAFRADFYHSLGWGLVGELHAHRFRPEQLRTHEPAAVRLASTDDYNGVAACYDRMMRRSHGPIERTAGAWQRHLGSSGGRYVYVLEDGAGVRGYMIVRYGGGASRDRRVLHVTELVADDDAAYERLLGWIALQRDLWRRVAYEASPDEHFAFRLRDPRPPAYRHSRGLWDPVARSLRGPMLRIVDLRAALAGRNEWGDARPFAFAVEMQDPELPENSLPLRVAWDGECIAIEEAGAGVETRLVASSAALAQIYTGELSVSAACRLGEAEASGDVAALNRLFATRSAFRLLDDF